MNIIANTLAKLVVWEFINIEESTPMIIPQAKVIQPIRVVNAAIIRSNLQRLLKYLLLKEEIMRYWSSKGYFQYLQLLNSKEDLEVFYNTIRNVNVRRNR